MNQENRYYNTAWRRESAFPGGFVLDGGVHHMAVLRLILGEITEVSAVSRLIRADLAPVDSLNAALVFESGLTGMYSITYAAGSPWPAMLHIVGDWRRAARPAGRDRGHRRRARPAGRNAPTGAASKTSSPPLPPRSVTASRSAIRRKKVCGTWP